MLDFKYQLEEKLGDTNRLIFPPKIPVRYLSIYSDQDVGTVQKTALIYSYGGTQSYFEEHKKLKDQTNYS